MDILLKETIAERDRLRAAFQRIADHHENQRALLEESGNADIARYHEDRRNFALFHLLKRAPSE